MAINAQRLLNVARALRESPNPDMFDMGLYAHACRTPACAFGHYAYRDDLQDEFLLNLWGWPCLASTGVDTGAFDTKSLAHFGITFEQAVELFNGDTAAPGCGGAKTAIEAAEYIERWIAEREAQP